MGRKRSKGKKDEKQPEQRPEMSFSEYALLMQDSMTRLGLYADLLVEGVAGPGGEATPRGGHPRRVTFEPEVDPTSSGASKLIKHARKLVGFGGGLGPFRDCGSARWRALESTVFQGWTRIRLFDSGVCRTLCSMVPSSRLTSA